VYINGVVIASLFGAVCPMATVATPVQFVKNSTLEILATTVKAKL